MEKNFIMTAFGKDRPGIAADVTEVIFESGCNLKDTTMTRLSNEFTLILLFSGQGDNLENKLTRECRRLEIEKGLSAFIRPVGVRLSDPSGEHRHTLRVEGLDQAGIVNKVSRYLADNKVNIENLTSKRTISPESGAALYAMKIEVTVPETFSMDGFEDGLDRIGAELNVDIAVS